MAIGKNCLFANNIKITTTDSHAIFSLKTKQRINPAESVAIGNQVWICDNVSILKGTVIADDSVCAMGSIVNKKFIQPNVILAGVPAKITLTDVCWRQNIQDTLDD